MPHVRIEYTQGVCLPESPRVFLQQFNHALSEVETFNVKRIKSICYLLEDYCIGAGKEENRGFVYARIAMLPGRSDTLRSACYEHMLSFLKKTLLPVNTHLKLHLSIEGVELKEYLFLSGDSALT